MRANREGLRLGGGVEESGYSKGGQMCRDWNDLASNKRSRRWSRALRYMLYNGVT
jgi:hypothetical protein